MSKASDVTILEISYLPITALEEAQWNPKEENDPEKFDRFVSSLKRGVTPIHVCRRAEDPQSDIAEVCDGNHRFRGLKRLGVKAVPVFDHGRKTLAERKEINLRYDGWEFASNMVSLAECLQEVTSNLPDFVMASPFSELETHQLLATLNFDVEVLHTPAYTESDDEEEEAVEPAPAKVKPRASVKVVTCPHCGAELNL